MLNFFPRPETPKRDDDDEDSPVKGNAKAENEKVAPEDPGHHDDSS